MAPSTWWALRTTTEAAWPTQDLATADGEEHAGVLPVGGRGPGDRGVGRRAGERGLHGDVGHEVLHRLEAPDRSPELLALLTWVSTSSTTLHGADDLAHRASAPRRWNCSPIGRDDGAHLLEVSEVELHAVARLAGEVAASA